MRYRLSIPLTLTVVCTVLLNLGWLLAPIPATAATSVPVAPARTLDRYISALQTGDEDDAAADEDLPGVDGNTYKSPTYGYTLEWDDEIWTATDADSDRNGDYLRLSADAGDLYLEGFAAFDGDAAACLAAIVDELESDDLISDIEPLLDDDDAEIAGDDDGRAFAALTYTAELDEGPISITQYSECRTLAPGEAVLQIDHLTGQDEYEDESSLAADVLDTLTLLQPEDDATAEPADDEDAGPTPTTEPTAEDDAEDAEDAESTETAEAAAEAEEPTAEPEDEEPTEAPTNEADEVDADVDDEDQDEEADPDDLIGVDGDSYTSPTYGYTLEWDDAEWTAESATSEDDVDTLVLANDVSTLTLTGTAEFGENLDRCVRTARRALEAGDGIQDVSAVRDENDEPIEIDEDDRAGAVFGVFLDDPDGPPDQIAQIECRVAVAGEAVIQIVQIADAADFNGQIEPISAVLDTITPEDEDPAADEDEETPEANDEPAPDAEDADANEDEESAVDGNTYVSPNFGYSLEWDEDVWEFDPTGGENSQPGLDTLFLTSSNSSVIIVGTDGATDPEGCVDDFASFFRSEPDVDDWTPYEDEDGERVEGEIEDGYFAAFTFTVSQGVQDFELIYYLECRTLVEDESVILIAQTTDEAAYDDATTEREELLEGLTLPDERRDGDADEDQGDDEDSTSEDEEEDPDTAAEPDLDSYTDPDFPFTVTWDENVWSVTDQRSVEDGHNLLNLQAEGGDLTIEGWARWDGVPADCLNDISTNLQALDGVEDFSRVADTDLYPDGSATDGAGALYAFTLAPEGRTPVEYYGYVECRTVVEGEAVVVVTLIVPAEEYEAVRPDFEPILASIEIDES